VLRKEFQAALTILAEALLLDKVGQFRERLLQKQTEVLRLLANRTGKEFYVMANRVRHFAGKNEDAPALPLESSSLTQPIGKTLMGQP
jgi:hypothetical protein